MEFEEYLARNEAIHKKNDEYLTIFKQDLVAANLKEKTINNHLENVSFYLNYYLLGVEDLEMQAGYDDVIDSFFGHFFIPKATWATPATIKATATSIRKFYKSMLDHGYVEKEHYDELHSIIKSDLSIWQTECKEYNESLDEAWDEDWGEDPDDEFWML